MALKMISIQDVRDCLADEIVDEYENKYEFLIKNSQNWNDLYGDVPIKYIALYVIIHKPRKPKYKIEEELLKAIRKQKSKYEIKILKDKVKSNEYTFFNDYDSETLNDQYLNNILGIYGNYYRRNNEDEEIIDISDTKKKYLYLKQPWHMTTIHDEFYNIKRFIYDITEEQTELIKLYKRAKKLNKHYYRRKKNKTHKEKNFLPSDIDNMLKLSLQKRLSNTGISISKINRLVSTTIRALKKENFKSIN